MGKVGVVSASVVVGVYILALAASRFVLGVSFGVGVLSFFM